MQRAAVYARKSTGDDPTTLDAQLAAGRAFAEARGWTVVGAFKDLGVSGAAVAKKLRGREQLMDLARSGKMNAIIVRDESRLSRRDGDEALAELKKLDALGVEVWYYQTGTRFTHGTFGENVVGYVKAEMAAEYRRQIQKWTDDKKREQFEAGDVMGGYCFGYRTVDGKRVVVPEEAEVVRDIYKRYARGHGLKTIAHSLNREGALAPKPQRGRPRGWAISTVRELIRRPTYRGVETYGQSRSRRTEFPSTKPMLTRESPHLRIVSEQLAAAVDGRLAATAKRARKHTRVARALPRRNPPLWEVRLRDGARSRSLHMRHPPEEG